MEKPNIVSDVIEMLRPLVPDEREAVLRAVKAYFDITPPSVTLGRTGSVDKEAFAADWERARSLKEVCALHHITEGSARTIASSLRKKGVKLKSFKH